jgi:iron-sulfur cluster insertion protein
MISLTDIAKQKLKEIAEAEGLANQFVRVKVIGGGCAGFSYDMYFEEKTSDADEIIEIEPDIKLAVDPLSLQYLEGVTIDYLDSQFGAGFKFLNPNVTGSCGCGNSVSF